MSNVLFLPPQIPHEVFSARTSGELKLPLFLEGVPAGFPSPADDYVETNLDLNEHLVRHPAATFFVRVKGDSMVGAGIQDGDIMVVDRSVTPSTGQVVLAAINGEVTVKRLLKVDRGYVLQAENPVYPARRIKDGEELNVWGVVTYVIHKV